MRGSGSQVDPLRSGHQADDHDLGISRDSPGADAVRKSLGRVVAEDEPPQRGRSGDADKNMQQDEKSQSQGPLRAFENTNHRHSRTDIARR